MSEDLKGLLERSRSPGKLKERRQFSLSREKALEKMREFSLRDPATYILELVQAAVFADARWIAIDVSPERLFFAWIGGRHPTPQQLEHVFDYLFLDRADAETRHVVQLAIGLNALLQRKPRSIAIEAGDGRLEGTARLELSAAGAGHFGRPESAIHGTWLSVDFSQSWLSRFAPDEALSEVNQVQRACQHCPVPILLNYRAPFGYRSRREISLPGFRDVLSVDENGRRILLAMPTTTDQARKGFQIVVGGVHICNRVLPALGLLRVQGASLPLVGVICDDRLRKTADQGDIVEDDRFTEMLHAVQPHATALIRTAPGHAGHQPPVLPRIPTAAPRAAHPRDGAGTALVAEPLPEPLLQVGARPAMRLADLKARPPQSPLFWVQPEAVDGLGRAVDPRSFPHSLLILRPGQALSLAAELGQGAVAWLQTGTEAEFLSRAMEQKSRVHEVQLALGPDEGLGARATLILRHHLDGPPPTWAGNPPDSTPMLVQVQGTTVWCNTLRLDLPGCSAVLELRDGSFDRERGPPRLLALVRRHAWRLLLARLPGAGSDRTPIAELTVAVLAMGLCQHFVGTRPSTLALSLPTSWGALAGQLRRLPLLETTGASLSLDELLDALNQPGPTLPCFEVADPIAFERLAPLAQRLGTAHFRLAGSSDRALLTLVLPDRGFSRWARGRVDGSGVGGSLQAMLVLVDSFQAELVAPGWTLGQRLGPNLVLLLPEGGSSPPEARIRNGLELMLDQLVRVVATDHWSELVPDPQGQERARQAGRLALLHLTTLLRPANARCVLASDGKRSVSLDELSDEGQDLHLAPRHGVRVVESSTVLVSWAELRVLEQAGLPIRLRFDDHPDIWTLSPEPAEAEGLAAEADGWLIREPLRIPGLVGWVGLRRPYDPTCAVWIQESGELIALSVHEGQLPCHGMAWSISSDDSVGPEQRAQLEIARLALYQSLAERLGQETDPAWRTEAEAYAIDFAVEAWRRAASHPPTTTARRLSGGLRLYTADGTDAGSVQSWLETDPQRRPAVRGHADRWRRVEAIVGASSTPLVGLGLTNLSRRLGLALATVVPDHSPKVELVRTEGQGTSAARWLATGPDDLTIQLELDDRHPLVAEALSGSIEATNLLLIELGRICRRALEREDLVVPLVVLQDRLLAPTVR